MSEKTLAMLVLDGQKVQYRVIRYDSTLRDAEAIARQIDVKSSQVYKTLVATRPAGKPFLAMIAADCQLDLKKMARSVGEKKVKMASQREAEKLTGLQVGGISALALLNRGFVICLDSSARAHDKVCVSAGKRGIQLEVATEELIRVSKARVLSLSR